MTTNPPTQTVSGPTYLFHPDNHLLDKKPTESDKDMEWTTNPPTEPTVEKWEEILKKAEKYVRANSVYYGNDQYRLSMTDWLYFIKGVANEVEAHSVQEAKAEERKLVVGEIKDNLRVIKKGTTGDMRTAISSVEAMWALNTDPEYRAIYKSSDEYKKDITKAEIKLIERLISFRSPYVYDKYSSLGQQGNQINSEYFIEEGKLLESIRTDLLASLKQEEEKV